MKNYSRKFQITAIFVAVMLVAVSPSLAKVSAIDSARVFEGIDYSDFGITGYYDFSNITYTIDGTGVDVLSSGMGSGSQAVNTVTHSLSLKTKMGFGIYNEAGNFQSYETLRMQQLSAGSGSGIEVTNETTADETFAYDDRARYDTGRHNFISDFDEDTTWYNDNVSTACNAFNVTADYTSLNHSLSDAAVIDIDDYFNNAGDNKDDDSLLEDMKVETFAVGYEECESGVINDARSYLAQVNSVDYDKIVITSYNFTQAQIAYNLSDNLRTKFKGAIDEAMENPVSDNSGLIQTVSGATLGIAQVRVERGLLGRIGSSVRHSSISFGTRLRQFGKSASDWLGSSIQSVQKKAASAFNTAGGMLKSAISKGQTMIVDTTKGWVEAGGQLVTRSVNAVVSTATNAFKVLFNPVIILVVIAIICALVYVVAKKKQVL